MEVSRITAKAVTQMLIWRLIAIILCSPLTRLYLINYARPLIFTTFMSYPSLAAIRASYTFMASGETQQVILAKQTKPFPKLTTYTSLLYACSA